MIGIDIESSCIQLLELGTSTRAPHVIGHAREPMPDGAFEHDQIQDTEAVAEVLIRAWQRSGSQGRHAALAIADSLVDSRIVKLPASWHHTQVIHHLTQETSRYFPEAEPALSLDYQILGPCPREANQNRVLVAACPKACIALLAAVTEMARLRACRVMTKSHALHNACRLLFDTCRHGPAADGQIVIDIAPSATRLHVIQAGQLHQARSIAPGSKALDTWLCRHYQVRHPGELRGAIQTAGDRVEQALNRILSLADQLAPRLARLWPNTSRVHDDQPSPVITGLATCYPGLVSRLEHQLDTSLIPANPLASCLAGRQPRLNGVETLAPGLMVAAGLSVGATG